MINLGKLKLHKYLNKITFPQFNQEMEVNKGTLPCMFLLVHTKSKRENISQQEN